MYVFHPPLFFRLQTMQFEGDAYANVARKLIYTFSRSCKPGENPMCGEESEVWTARIHKILYLI